MAEEGRLRHVQQQQQQQQQASKQSPPPFARTSPRFPENSPSIHSSVLAICSSGGRSQGSEPSQGSEYASGGCRSGGGGGGGSGGGEERRRRGSGGGEGAAAARGARGGGEGGVAWRNTAWHGEWLQMRGRGGGRGDQWCLQVHVRIDRDEVAWGAGGGDVRKPLGCGARGGGGGAGGRKISGSSAGRGRAAAGAGGGDWQCAGARPCTPCPT